MMGVPARQRGWMSRHGIPLENPADDGVYTCPESGLNYKEDEAGDLRCLEVDEDAELPEDMRSGKGLYESYAHSGQTD